MSDQNRQERLDKPLLKDQNLYLIFSITLIGVMGVASITPAFPKMAEIFNISSQKVGYLISVFTLPGIFLTPFLGVLADRFGRKTVLVPALLLFVLQGLPVFMPKALNFCYGCAFSRAWEQPQLDH